MFGAKLYQDISGGIFSNSFLAINKHRTDTICRALPAKLAGQRTEGADIGIR